jgi:hypothetical protein
MHIYLLGTTCIADIAANNSNPAWNWFYSTTSHPKILRRDVFISAFSIVKLHDNLARLPNDTNSHIFRNNVDRLIQCFERLDRVEGATPEVVKQWERLLPIHIVYTSKSGPQAIGIEEKMVLATALCGNGGGGYTLVEPFQAEHKRLAVNVCDPYNGTYSVP